MARRRCGFTLIELIVASTVAVLVSGATVLLVRNLTAAQVRADRQSELQQEARLAAHAVATALRNAYRPPIGAARAVDDWPLLVAEPGRRGDLAADQIRVLSVSHRAVRTGEPEADVHEVAFELLDVQDEPLPVLVRRTDPALNDPDDAGGVLDRLARRVVSFELSYFDGVQWRQQWHSHDDGWPLAIRLRMLVVAESTPGVPPMQWPVRQLIGFAHHERRAGIAGGRGDD